VLPVGQHLSTIGNVGDFFALLVSHPFKGSGAKTGAGPQKGESRKWHGVKQRRPICRQSGSGCVNIGPIKGRLIERQ
jgi:hypothetical protein